MDQHTPIPEVPEKKPVSAQRTILFAILGTFMAIGLVTVGFYAGSAQKNSLENTTFPSPTPIVTHVEEESQLKSGIPITEKTVSFTSSKEEIFLRYKNKIYTEDDPKTSAPQEVDSSTVAQAEWIGLVDSPLGVLSNSFDEIFSYKQIPDSKNFLFVMRWTKPNTMETPIYYYDNLANPSLVSIDIPAEKESYSFPKISEISYDGKYVSFNMYGCWNCGGHPPETLLVNLQSKATKRIGKLSYFAWKTNGAYEYKDYVTKPCPTQADGSEFMGPGVCSEEPANLPLKTGTM